MPPVPALSNQFDRAKGRALATVKGRLVAIAKSRHATVMGRDPRPSRFLRIVDGRVGAVEEMVKATGIITYVYERTQIGFERDEKETAARLGEVVKFALATLRDLSPVGTGRDPHPGLYRDSHQLFRNGYPVSGLLLWKPGDEVSITNYVDYSRILEVGDKKFRLPLKVYERAADIVEEKYGQDAKIEFTWRGIVATYQIPQEASRRRGFGVNVAARSRRHNVAQFRFPTLVISPKSNIVEIAGRIGRAIEIGANTLAVANALGQLASSGHGKPAPLSLSQGIVIDG
jgi:hypothetical protein